ncbi:DUF2798 domain-containing protein [Acidovorax sp.]|uniref:DUF2798 domain-containing protein n=1 Tax=Acidovorax sp. TaxID=1872122 RepID=UPI002ACE14E2|nr:DUF2798 domain-containing protein [Acidovorax sp.]MDZ7865949.1 DUF2798 domain-containing protein [Acidovorax sp.]
MARWCTPAGCPAAKRSSSGFASDALGELPACIRKKGFRLVFSMVMGAPMIFVMTFVIIAVNVGWSGRLLEAWAKAFCVAYVVGVPLIFPVAPIVRKLTGKLLGTPPSPRSARRASAKLREAPP